MTVGGVDGYTLVPADIKDRAIGREAFALLRCSFANIEDSLTFVDSEDVRFDGITPRETDDPVVGLNTSDIFVNPPLEPLDIELLFPGWEDAVVEGFIRPCS